LLEAVNRLCGDAEVQGMLPALYASRGIAAGNAKRWQQAVDDLRQARKLNPHSRQAGENLVTALRARGGELCRNEPEQACVLLEEAVAVAEESLRGDPGSGPLEEQVRFAQRELAVALNAHALFLNDLGRSDDALALLRRARDLDPEDATLRQNEADISQARRARARVAEGDARGALEDVLRSVYEEEG
jgi:tetratricopeptide (TPR) repeat protein